VHSGRVRCVQNQAIVWEQRIWHGTKHKPIFSKRFRVGEIRRNHFDTHLVAYPVFDVFIPPKVAVNRPISTLVLRFDVGLRICRTPRKVSIGPLNTQQMIPKLLQGIAPTSEATSIQVIPLPSIIVAVGHGHENRRWYFFVELHLDDSRLVFAE
jgi:hypothetical protein